MKNMKNKVYQGRNKNGISLLLPRSTPCFLWYFHVDLQHARLV